MITISSRRSMIDGPRANVHGVKVRTEVLYIKGGTSRKCAHAVRVHGAERRTVEWPPRGSCSSCPRNQI